MLSAPIASGRRPWIVYSLIPCFAVALTLDLLVAAPAAVKSPADESALAAADGKALDRLFMQGLFDPAGHRFVRFKVITRAVWGEGQKQSVAGWLIEPTAVEAAEGECTWAVTLSGEAVPVVGETKEGDFVAECKAMLEHADAKAKAAAAAAAAAAVNADAQPAKKGDRDDFDETFRQMRRVGFQPPGTVVPRRFLAAWLHRLGHDDVAARVVVSVARAKKAAEADPPKGADVRADPNDHDVEKDDGIVPVHMNEWHWYGAAVHAYMVRADAEALFYLKRLVKYFPDALLEELPPPKDAANDELRPRTAHYPEAAKLLVELKRRRKEQTFGKPVAGRPADLGGWPVERRVAYWIEQLQEADARQNGQPGGIDLAEDERVEALIDIGDPAVPALIDCIERDERLTRSVHFWRDFAPSRTVLGVREAALTAAMSILRTSVFEPASTGDNFTSRGETTAKDTARQLRAYWDKYGRLPFDERMMKFLTDPGAKPQAWREAAENLATLTRPRTLGTTVWAGGFRNRDNAKRAAPNPAIDKFKKPTVAEAILAAMDRDIAVKPANEQDRRLGWQRNRIEQHYVGALVELHDPKIISALQDRLTAAVLLPERRLIATACYELGEPKPLAELAADLQAGRLALSGEVANADQSDGDPNLGAFSDTVDTLSQVTEQLPAADDALASLSNAKHPYHRFAAAFAHGDGGRREWGRSIVHPFILQIVAQDLQDVSMTGESYSVEEAAGELRLATKSKNSSGSSSLSGRLRDPSIRRESAEVRVCDEAAMRLSSLVLGMPFSHPLLKDRDRPIQEIKAFMDAHGRHLRRITAAEAELFGNNQGAYVLNVRPRAAGATADDVKSGSAIFHFDGTGAPVDLKLPATCVLRRDLPPGDRQPSEANVQAGRAQRVRDAQPATTQETDDEEIGDGIERPEPPFHLEWITPRVLILQAERGPDGKVYYGIVGNEEIQKLSNDLVSDVKPLSEVR